MMTKQMKTVRGVDLAALPGPSSLLYETPTEAPSRRQALSRAVNQRSNVDSRTLKFSVSSLNKLRCDPCVYRTVVTSTSRRMNDTVQLTATLRPMLLSGE